MLIEFPVLVAVTAKPAAAIIMPFVGETHRDAVLAERPNFLDQAVVKLMVPLARQERFDGSAALKKFRAIAPATIGCIGKRDASRVACVPRIFGHSHLLCGGLGCEGRERRAAHLNVLVCQFWGGCSNRGAKSIISSRGRNGVVRHRSRHCKVIGTCRVPPRSGHLLARWSR